MTSGSAAGSTSSSLYPGLTAIKDPVEAWREHVERSLEALQVVRRYDGSIVDVGSGGGSPGIPIAAALPEREVVLLEAQVARPLRSSAFAAAFPNVRVVRGRAEEQATDCYAVALARALAQPPIAAEWCLPLVEPGRCGRALRRAFGGRRTCAAGRLSSRRRTRRTGRRTARDSQGRAHPGGLPEAAWSREEASACVSSLARWRGSTRSRTRRAGSARRRPPSTSQPASRRPARRALVVDLDPQANATSGLGESANGTSSYDLLDGAPLERAREADALREPLARPREGRARRRRRRARAPR